jgi:aspartyl-tRNA(Asn)/glutamyl-tRNA(Gln) amidotransferase subunit A
MAAEPDLTTASGIAEAVRSGAVRAREVLELYLGRIAERNDRHNAFVHLEADAALRAATAIDEQISRGEDPGLLAGVPFGVKDLEDCAGMPTSHGSLLHKDDPLAELDSPPVAKARAAGGVPVGKTAAPEFGLHTITVSPAWGVTRNPWDRTRSPGGSSGGSAAAVAAGMVPLATASDGGGSTRSPAAFTGLVGHKPSHGRIGRDRPGDVSVSGCLSLTVRDTARFLDVTAGPTPFDRTSLPSPGIRYESVIEALDVVGLRAAWSPDYGSIPVEPEVIRVAREAAESLVTAAGLRWSDREIALPNPYPTWVAEVVIEMRGELERTGDWPDRIHLLSDRVRDRLFMADDYGFVHLARAAHARFELEKKVAAIFEEVDVLLTPVTTIVSLPAEGPVPRVIAGRDASETGAEAHLMPANMCWLPAISVPAGLSSDGFPIGLQIVCRRFRDDIALRLARILELTRPWPHRAPAYR